ncbi:MAG: hypothetical protein WBW49_22885, partial [Candidatus Acidiferrum sp.]
VRGSRYREPLTRRWARDSSGGNIMKSLVVQRRLEWAAVVFVTAAVYLLGSMALYAQGAGALSGPAGNTVKQKIPAGTILPIVLATRISFAKANAGQTVDGKIAQDVPLPDGSKIRKGSAVQGHVVEVSAGANGPQVTIRFDQVRLGDEWIPVVTDLRAIAGFMTIQQAYVPIEAPGEGSPYDWLPRNQIGGDSVYGVGGPVTSAEDPSKVIGKAVDDGVLVEVSAKQGTPCRGAIENNDRAQAMWVFSGDACGVYGIEHLRIAHAGRTNPQGQIVLVAERTNLKLSNGDGLLLRVQ